MNAEQEQALAAFEHAADELRFFKGQQWAVSNYALILQAALASIPQAFNLRHLSTAIGKERGRMATPGPACRYLRAFTGRTRQRGASRAPRSCLAPSCCSPASSRNGCSGAPENRAEQGLGWAGF